MINAFSMSAAIATKYEAQIGAVMAARYSGQKLKKETKSGENKLTRRGEAIRRRIVEELEEQGEMNTDEILSALKNDKVTLNSLRGHLVRLRQANTLNSTPPKPGQLTTWWLA